MGHGVFVAECRYGESDLVRNGRVANTMLQGRSVHRASDDRRRPRPYASLREAGLELAARSSWILWSSDLIEKLLSRCRHEVLIRRTGE